MSANKGWWVVGWARERLLNKGRPQLESRHNIRLQGCTGFFAADMQQNQQKKTLLANNIRPSTSKPLIPWILAKPGPSQSQKPPLELATTSRKDGCENQP